MARGAGFVGRLTPVIEFSLCQIFIGCSCITIIVLTTITTTTTTTTTIF
jgi:hypothetical protein